LKKFIQFIKGWWQSILLLLVSVYAFFAVKKAKKEQTKAVDTWKENTEKLQKLSQEEREKLKEIQKRYDAIIEQLRKKKELENEKIENWQREEIAKIVATSKLTPEQKAQKISEKFGITIVK
jgi:F0F1-type ATP synthase membrane subunit b/b'